MLEKRRFRILLLFALFTALLSIEVCMELRYARNEPVVTSEDTASVLRQFPQVEITEEDRAMMQDFFQCAAVGELLESGGSGDVSAVSEPELRAAAERYLSRESAASVIVNKIFYEGGPSLSISWTEDEGNHMFILEKEIDDGKRRYYKAYTPEQGTIYKNWDNERAQEVVFRRRWFAWLRDRT